MVDCKVRIHTDVDNWFTGMPPFRGHSDDAGLDLASPQTEFIDPNGSVVIDTMVSVEIPKGYAGFIVPRSSNNVLYAESCTGLIDANFTGTIKVRVYNHGDVHQTIKQWERFCQLVIFKVPKVRLVLDYVGSKEKRGSDGYGSTGR